MKQYTIVSARSAPELTNKVRVLSEYGWEPIGGMITTHFLINACYNWSQAMIREVEEDQKTWYIEVNVHASILTEMNVKAQDLANHGFFAITDVLEINDGVSQKMVCIATSMEESLIAYMLQEKYS